MIRSICKDEAFLSQRAEAATPADLGTAQDLLDTLIDHRHDCVGMAANMISINKRIIAFEDEGKYTVMFNPVIVKSSGPYEAEEGCLSAGGAIGGGEPEICGLIGLPLFQKLVHDTRQSPAVNGGENTDGFFLIR